MAQIDHDHVPDLHYPDEPCPLCTALWMLERYESLLDAVELTAEQQDYREQTLSAWKPPRRFEQTVHIPLREGEPLRYDRQPV